MVSFVLELDDTGTDSTELELSTLVKLSSLEELSTLEELSSLEEVCSDNSTELVVELLDCSEEVELDELLDITEDVVLVELLDCSEDDEPLLQAVRANSIITAAAPDKNNLFFILVSFL